MADQPSTQSPLALVGRTLGQFVPKVPSKKLVRRVSLILLVLVILIGGSIAAAFGALGVGHEGNTQFGVNNTALFIASNGTCLPKGASTYVSLFNNAGQTNNVNPYLLIAIAQQESNFNPNAKSPTGNVGLMQISVDKANGGNAYDPETNINAGAKYIRAQLTAYSGKGADQTTMLGQYVKSNLDLALAAYNAGPGNVSNHVPSIPETVNYVQVVEGNYQTILSCLNKQSTTTNSGTTPSTIGELKQGDSQWQTEYAKVDPGAGQSFAAIGCGATSTAMGLEALGISGYDPVQVKQIEETAEGSGAIGHGVQSPATLGTQTMSGIPSLSMTNNVPWSQAQTALQAGQPVLLGMANGSPNASATQGLSAGPSGHYVLLYGYDSTTNTYTVHDPAFQEGQYAKQVSATDIQSTNPFYFVMSRK